MEDIKSSNNIVKSVIVKGRRYFCPESYYFVLYDDGNYSLFSYEDHSFLGGCRFDNPEEIFQNTKEECNFRHPDVALGKHYRELYDAINAYQEDLGKDADRVEEKFGVKTDRLASFYYYDPDDSDSRDIWKQYKKLHRLFTKKCRKLGIVYEKDRDKIINKVLGKLSEREDELDPNKKVDVTFCNSIESIINKHEENLLDRDSVLKLSMLCSSYEDVSMNLVNYSSEFLNLSDRAMVALVDDKNSSRELIRQYAEFLICLPIYCQLISYVGKCISDTKERVRKLKMDTYYSDEKFIDGIEEMIKHDDEHVYLYHVAQAKEDADKINQDGLYMYSDRLSSTTYEELSCNDILKHGYGSNFVTYEDYIIVIDKPKDENIVRELSDEEREVVSILPRRIALTSKPTHIIDPEHIVGYVDKFSKQVVYNDKYVGNKTLGG